MIVGGSNHGMAKSVGRRREFEWHGVAKSHGRLACIIFCPELEKMRRAAVDDPADDCRLADTFQIAFHDQPLIVQTRQELCRMEIRDPAGIVTGQKVHALLWNLRKLKWN